MSGISEPLDVRLLVRWLGTEGARAGITKSKACTIESLTAVAASLGIETERRPKRQDLIDEIVRVASRRIDRSLDELFDMKQDELVDYFEQTGVEADELVDLLKKLDLDPGREARRNLVEFVARELSETGRFMRIASKGSNGNGSGG